jgi:restriction endonuclease S subunit
VSEPPKIAQKTRQQRRLSAALRENLKRRRAQAQRRKAAGATKRESHDSAGIGEDKRDDELG